MPAKDDVVVSLHPNPLLLLHHFLGLYSQREEGYEVTTADDGRDAVHILRHSQFDVVITDMVMPRVNGVEVLLAAKRIDPSYPVIVITGYPSVNTAVRLVSPNPPKDRDGRREDSGRG